MSHLRPHSVWARPGLCGGRSGSGLQSRLAGPMGGAAQSMLGEQVWRAAGTCCPRAHRACRAAVHRTEPALGTGLVVESLGWKQVKPVALWRTSHLHRGVEGLRAHSSRWWSGWGRGGEQRSGRERASGQHPPGWRKLCTQTERGPNLEDAIHLATLKGVRPTANELGATSGPRAGKRDTQGASPQPEAQGGLRQALA